MAKLLGHLFEVTERFGMETRTELILLQRTMVVVEGVARSLNPAMNMWETARPVVSDYITETLGPKAISRDLANTVRILSRFGPRLPQLAEELLIRTNSPTPPVPGPGRQNLYYAIGGGAVGAAIVGLLSLF